MRLGWSSHVYPLEAADFDDVPDYAGESIPVGELPSDRVVLLIRKGHPDSLVRGRDEIVRRAGGTVDVRVVFVPSVSRWNLLGTLVRVCRNRYRYHGSRVYHISAKAVRGMKIERAIRTTDNPQQRAGKDRAACMVRLLESLKRDGYRDDKPIVVMLCRTGGLADSLRQGHHRVSACLACGVDRMAVEFAAAGVAPWQRWGVFRRVATVVAACAGIAAAAWALWPAASWEATMDVRGLPKISPIGEFVRPRVPEELSGITYVDGDSYYAVSDDGSGIWPMQIGLDRATGVITNCVMGRNVRVGKDNEGIAWNPQNRTVFVTDEASHAISEINPETGQLVAEVRLPEHQRKRRSNRGLESLTLSPGGEFLWTANYEGVCLGPVLGNGDRTLVMVSDGGDADDERLYSLRMKEERE